MKDLMNLEYMMYRQNHTALKTEICPGVYMADTNSRSYASIAVDQIENNLYAYICTHIRTRS